MLVLREYYRQDLEVNRSQPSLNLPEAADSKPRLREEDEWTLEWISIGRLQAIAEAFDDDASGFITVAEVNKLTSSRPNDWRYVAYFIDSQARLTLFQSPTLASVLGDRYDLRSSASIVDVSTAVRL